MTDFTLRRSTPDDAADVAAIWHQGWHQAHVGHVPEGLAAARTLAAFHERASLLVAGTTAALADGAVVGFVMVVDDEVEQLFVTPWARGTGLAAQLLTEGEQQVQTAGHRLGWLAVVAGNARARRFYERRGWVDEGDLAYEVVAGGATYISPCRRYTKRLD